MAKNWETIQEWWRQKTERQNSEYRTPPRNAASSQQFSVFWECPKHRERIPYGNTYAMCPFHESRDWLTCSSWDQSKYYFWGSENGTEGHWVQQSLNWVTSMTNGDREKSCINGAKASAVEVADLVKVFRRLLLASSEVHSFMVQGLPGIWLVVQLLLQSILCSPSILLKTALFFLELARDSFCSS
jgi:hypothetical protein